MRVNQGNKALIDRDYLISVSLGLEATDEPGGFTSKGENIPTTLKLLAHSSLSEPPYPFLTSPTTLTLSSSSDEDISTGTGMYLFQASTLDANYNIENQFVVANGKNAVNLSGTAMRAINLIALDKGSGNTGDGTGRYLPAGIIYLGYGTVTNGVPANILATMEPADATEDGEIVTFIPVYTIPDGLEAVITSLFFDGSPEDIIEVRFGVRLFGIDNIFRSAAYHVDGQLEVLPQLPSPSLPPRSDLMFFAKRLEKGLLPHKNNASCQAQANFILREEE